MDDCYTISIQIQTTAVTSESQKIEKMQRHSYNNIGGVFNG